MKHTYVHNLYCSNCWTGMGGWGFNPPLWKTSEQQSAYQITHDYIATEYDRLTEAHPIPTHPRPRTPHTVKSRTTFKRTHSLVYTSCMYVPLIPSTVRLSKCLNWSVIMSTSPRSTSNCQQGKVHSELHWSTIPPLHLMSGDTFPSYFTARMKGELWEPTINSKTTKFITTYKETTQCAKMTLLQLSLHQTNYTPNCSNGNRWYQN